MSYKFGTGSSNRLKTTDERLIVLAQAAIHVSPIDFGIGCGHRTVEDQQIVYLAGKSKCDGIEKKSNHNYYPSKAFDVYAWVNGKASYDERHMAIIFGVINTVATELGTPIVWGGTFESSDFTGWDGCHYELKEK